VQSWTLGLVTWLGAAFGIAINFFPGRFDRLAFLVYLALG
jgi:predicted membrane channel-forming protein YqfA (hemolysin III family)